MAATSAVPAVNRAFCPSPTGLPKRRITAFSCGPTVKNPEQKKATTISPITILTIAKLLPSASASACEPASRRHRRVVRVCVVVMFVLVTHGKGEGFFVSCFS